MEDERKEKFQCAMKDEIDSFHENYTYDLVELPKGKRALRNKCVFKGKFGEDGSSPKYKARFVVWGFNKKRGSILMRSSHQS